MWFHTGQYPNTWHRILYFKYQLPEVTTCEHLLGLYSLSGKTSYRKISWSLEAARFGFKLFQSALLPRCLSNFRAIRPLQHPISRLRDFTRFGGKTSYRLMNRGPDLLSQLNRMAFIDRRIAHKVFLQYYIRLASSCVFVEWRIVYRRDKRQFTAVSNVWKDIKYNWNEQMYTVYLNHYTGRSQYCRDVPSSAVYG